MKYTSIFLVLCFINSSLVRTEITERHFNLIDKYHCTFDCHNATFADCSDTTALNSDFLIYIVNNQKETYNFETTHLKDLKNIGLSNLKGNFNGRFLGDFKSLESLSIIGFPWKNNDVDQLSDMTFLSNLKSFKLYNNNLGYLWNASKTLDLEFKKKIDCDQVLPSTIDYLDLVANKISYLPSWLSNLVDLNYLNLNYNELTYIPSGIFRNMKNLQYVYLSMNHLFEIKSIYPLSTLIYLDIKMQRNKASMRIDNFAFDVQNTQITNNEDVVIDLRTEPDQIKFNDLALCTTSEENAYINKSRNRKLFLLNREYDYCVLKQFQGVIVFYEFEKGVFSEETKEFDFRMCPERFQYSSLCEHITRCTERFNCNLHRRTTAIITTASRATTTLEESSKQTKGYTAFINPFISNIRERNKSSISSTTESTTKTLVIENKFQMIGSNNDVSERYSATTTTKVEDKQRYLDGDKKTETETILANTGSCFLTNESNYYFKILLLIAFYNCVF